MPRESLIQNVHYFHLGKNTCNEGKGIKTYLMLIRNPLTRIQSWFNFEKNILPSRKNKQAEIRLRWKRGMIFNECYNTFADLVINGIGTIHRNRDSYKILSGRPINMTCPERALAALLGVREFSYHEWYNYEYYWTTMQDNYRKLSHKSSSRLSANSPSLLVLRTEHLREDWSGLSKENLFRHVNKGIPTTYGNFTSKDVDHNFLHTDYSSYWVYLCYVMCPEIQIYKEILQYSDNLNAFEVQQSINEIRNKCPLESSGIRTCTGIPKFPLLKVLQKEYHKETKKRLFTF